MVVFPADHPLTPALTERDYIEPTAVQAAVLEAAAECRDLLVSAQTGSGKTVAYGLAIAEPLLAGARTLPPAGEPLALIVAPTRELALQVQSELDWLYRPVGGRVASAVGGMDPRSEQRVLARGAHIVVGTPGRIRDHLERGRLHVASLKAVVLDEADEMLDLGFREDLEFILEATPAERHTLLFSATLPAAIAALAGRYQRNAKRINVAAGQRGHADIEYRAIRVAADQTAPSVVNLLRFFDSPTAMVFCNTRESVRRLQSDLGERGFPAVALSGELGQNERNQALQALRDGRARVCVATDVAARGIDLPNLGLVIHAELPQNGETLQHRSGRTGRAGRKGVSALLVPSSRRRKAERLLQTAGVTAAWSDAPSASDIRALDRDRLLSSPCLTETPDAEDLAMAQRLMAEHPAETIAAALVRLYRSGLPAAEDLAEIRAEDRRPVRPAANHSWFRLNIGRKQNADPRWLIPLICRQGGITKREIGTIRIFDQETAFEIEEGVAERFTAAVRQVERPDTRIEALAGEPEQSSEPRTAGPARRKDRAGPNRPAAKPQWKSKAPAKDRPRKAANGSARTAG
ncbi:DEAD/DEAH box helicase [Telmatospirillum siberiense]|uniref:DEAD/DEAH box helicase n=1 Tax=Telmatospirillum siberiense TaxID=382514 RepID=A0A2N3PPM1_9PROT|nr:DEAD/DEAH box helicase [Telmatospirillum siberiense]PKU22352.1 DEAD/DEAH box helicase [Telmatospirillum siberiense]